MLADIDFSPMQESGADPGFLQTIISAIAGTSLLELVFNLLALFFGGLLIWRAIIFVLAFAKGSRSKAIAAMKESAWLNLLALGGLIFTFIFGSLLGAFGTIGNLFAEALQALLDAFSELT